MKALNNNSNDNILYAFIGWNRCGQNITSYENCKQTGSIYNRNPEECSQQAKKLQRCYAQKGANIEPLCMPIFNDARQCLFNCDSHIMNCKQEINELTYCSQFPTEYVQFLKHSTPYQKLPKKYDFVKYSTTFDYN